MSDERKIRVEFNCGESKWLVALNYFPTTLIANATKESLRNDKDWTTCFMWLMKPIVIDHTETVYDTTAATCFHCKAPKRQVITNSVSWLHEITDPHVLVLTLPVCRNKECDRKAREQVLGAENWLMFKAGLEALAADGIRSVKHCMVCKKEDDILLCGRCGIAAYCGKFHQVVDWLGHKQVCKSLNAERLKAKQLGAEGLKTESLEEAESLEAGELLEAT